VIRYAVVLAPGFYEPDARVHAVRVSAGLDKALEAATRLGTDFRVVQTEGALWWIGRDLDAIPTARPEPTLQQIDACKRSTRGDLTMQLACSAALEEEDTATRRAALAVVAEWISERPRQLFGSGLSDLERTAGTPGHRP